MAICGEESLKNYECIKYEPKEHLPRKYVFGAGSPMEPLGIATLKICEDLEKFDVLAGRVGAIVGRKYLKKRKVKMNFENDTIILSGKSLSSPAHLLPLPGDAITREDTPGIELPAKEASASVDVQPDPVRSSALDNFSVFTMTVAAGVEVEHECDAVYDYINLASAVDEANRQNIEIEKALLKQWAEDHKSQARPSGVKQFWMDPSTSENKEKQISISR